MKRSIFFVGLALSLFAAVPAFAQNAPAAPVAAQGGFRRTPPTPAQAAGNLARVLVGPGGNARGLVLDNGTVVMLPRRGATDIAQRVRVGQPLRVEGFSIPGAASTTIFRATVRGADGSVLVAPPEPGAFRGRVEGGANENPSQPGGFGRGRFGHGRGGHGGFGRGGFGHGGFGHGGFGRGGREGFEARRAERAAHLAAMPSQAVNGSVQQVLAGPHGAPRALLFANNVTVYLPRPIAMQLRDRGVRVGESVRASGHGTSTAQGTGFVADRLAFADGTTLEAPIAAPAAPNAPTAR